VPKPATKVGFMEKCLQPFKTWNIKDTKRGGNQQNKENTILHSSCNTKPLINPGLKGFVKRKRSEEGDLGGFFILLLVVAVV